MSTFVFQVETRREEYTKNYIENVLSITAPNLDGRLWIPRRCIYGKSHRLMHPLLFPGYLFLDATDVGVNEYRIALREAKIYRLHLLLTDEDASGDASRAGGGVRWDDREKKWEHSIDHALKVTDQELEWIKILSGENPAEVFKVGRNVHFKSGSFVGLDAYIVKYDQRRHNVCVELEMFAEQKKIWIAVDEVVPVFNGDGAGTVGESVDASQWNYERFMELYRARVMRKHIPDGKFSHELGVSKQTVQKWKRGEIPYPEKIRAIADYFGVEVSELTSKSRVGV